MNATATSRLDVETRVRVNVTCEGILLTLNERGAVVRLLRAQAPEQQTTLAIEDVDGETLHLAARIVRSVPRAHTAAARAEHDVSVEFLGLPRDMVAAMRGIIDDYRTRPDIFAAAL